MDNISQKLGNEGEEMARKFLIKKGYEILETNWRFKKLEIDIIAKINDQMVFVEVKTRSTDAFGEPEIFVTKKKQKFLVAAAHHYLNEKNIDSESRFDVIAILQQQNNYVINHLEGAFYPVAG